LSDSPVRLVPVLVLSDQTLACPIPQRSVPGPLACACLEGVAAIAFGRREPAGTRGRANL